MWLEKRHKVEERCKSITLFSPCLVAFGGVLPYMCHFFCTCLVFFCLIFREGAEGKGSWEKGGKGGGRGRRGKGGGGKGRESV